jgi:putative copper resistance protein D
VTALFALTRALHFASLMAVFGASALLHQARGIGIDDGKWKARLYLAALVALITAGLSLAFVAQTMTDNAVAFTDLHTLALVATKTFYGKVFVWRFFLLLALCFACTFEGLHLLKALLAGAALALLGLVGHAAAAGAPSYETARAAVDALHLLCAGFWVGGLIVLAPAVIGKARDMAKMIALLKLFSRWGVASVAVLIAAGALNAVFILDIPMRWNGAYVTWLAIKIALAAVMMALALTNRFGVLPGLERGEKEAADTIPLTVSAELACALAILLIVGFLGLTAPMAM